MGASQGFSLPISPPRPYIHTPPAGKFQGEASLLSLGFQFSPESGSGQACSGPLPLEAAPLHLSAPQGGTQSLCLR